LADHDHEPLLSLALFSNSKRGMMTCPFSRMIKPCRHRDRPCAHTQPIAATDLGVYQIVDALKVNKTVDTLDVTNNPEVPIYALEVVEIITGKRMERRKRREEEREREREKMREKEREWKR